MQIKFSSHGIFILDIMPVCIEVEWGKCPFKAILANDSQKLRYFFNLTFYLRILDFIITDGHKFFSGIIAALHPGRVFTAQVTDYKIQSVKPDV